MYKIVSSVTCSGTVPLTIIGDVLIPITTACWADYFQDVRGSKAKFSKLGHGWP